MEYGGTLSWETALPGVQHVVSAFFQGLGYGPEEISDFRQVFRRGEQGLTGKLSLFVSGGSLLKIPVKVFVSYLFSPAKTDITVRYQAAEWLKIATIDESQFAQMVQVEYGELRPYVDSWRAGGHVSEQPLTLHEEMAKLFGTEADEDADADEDLEVFDLDD